MSKLWLVLEEICELHLIESMTWNSFINRDFDKNNTSIAG